MRWPERFRAGLVSDALVELVDLAPTLLDAAGLEVPGYMQGRSLVPLLAGEADPHRHKTSVVAEFNDALGSTRVPMPSHATMHFDGRFKTVVYHALDLGEIFDLEEDPDEFVNLWDAPAVQGAKAGLLHRHLDAVMATSSAGVERVGRF